MGAQAARALLLSTSRLALKNLLQDKLRFALSIIGIALAVMLMLFTLGLRQGLLQSVVVYLDKSPASLVVLPAGAQSSHGHGQFLPSETIEKIAATPGVERATPVQMQIAVMELHGKKETVQIVGYNSDLGGGPWNLAEGREPQADNEIVLDRALAGRHGFGVGDSFEIKGLQLSVTGLSNQTASMLGSYVFARTPLVEKLTLAPGQASYVLVTPASGTSRNDLMTTLQSLADTNVLPKSELMNNDRGIIAQVLDQIIYLMAAAAFIVGALVVGMVIYSATIERRGEYGILKAIGAGSGVLYRIVGWQALVAAGSGSLLGVGFAFVMGSLVTNLEPQYMVMIEPSAILITLVAGIVMALIGALFPARAVTGLAPAEVFRR